MRFRLLPVLAVAAAALFSVKLGAIWQGLEPLSADAAEAQGATDAPEALQLPLIAPAAGPAGDASAAGEGAAQDGGEATSGQADTLEAADPFDLSDEEIVLLQQLSKRREEIDAQAREVEQRSTLLAAAEERIEQKMAELRALQASIQEMLIEHDEQEEAQMRSLVKIYENMKPKDAARIFEQLDMIVLLEVVDRMKERKVAPILARMNPTKAKAVTLELAQRRELPMAKN